jgi:hypothetical protein
MIESSVVFPRSLSVMPLSLKELRLRRLAKRAAGVGRREIFRKEEGVLAALQKSIGVNRHKEKEP